MKKIIFTILPFLILPSCKSIEFSDPSGRHINYSTFGIDTSIGALQIHFPDGTSATVQNSVSNSDVAVGVVSKALDKVPNVPLIPIIP